MSEAIEEQAITAESSGRVPTKTNIKETHSSPVEALQEPGNEFGLDYHEEMDSGLFPAYGNKNTWNSLGDYHNPNPALVSRSRYHDRYRSPDVDGYGSLYNDSGRRTFSPTTQESLLGGDGDQEFLSPRSRYDLACGSSKSPYMPQWDTHDEFGNSLYESFSPRYKMESGPWGDREVGSLYDDPDRLFSSRERSHFGGLNYQNDMDSYPSSYTYGMRHASKYYPNPMHSPYHSPYHSGNSTTELSFNDDYVETRLPDARCYPFSDPSSPQPMYGHHGEGSELLRSPPAKLSFGHAVRMKFSPMQSAKKEPARSAVTTPLSPLSPATPVTPTTPATPATPATPTTPATPHGANSTAPSESAANEEQQYRIDAQTIMQNREERTVVIIRNIPNRYKLEDLQKVIRSFVDEEFTILRLPIDAFTKRNLGYAFVNFSDSHEVLKLYLKMNGQRWPNSNSVKTCSMCFAKKQVGFGGGSDEQNYVLYENPNESLSSYL